MSTVIITNMYPDEVAPYLGTFVRDSVMFFGCSGDVCYPGNAQRRQKLRFYFALYRDAVKRILASDKVVIHYPLFFSPLVAFSWLLGKEVNLVYHGGEFMRRPWSTPVFRLVQKLLFIFNNMLGDKLYVPTNCVAKEYFIRWNGKTVVWYSGGFVASDKSLSRNASWFDFGFFGRESGEKGYDCLMASLEKLGSRSRPGRRISVLIVCREVPRIARVSKGNVTIFFHPPLTKSRVISYIDRCEVVVIPSRAESLCLLALEAAARKALVLARDLPAIRETLSCFPIYFEKDEGLVDAMEAALLMDDDQKEICRRRLLDRALMFERSELYGRV